MCALIHSGWWTAAAGAQTCKALPAAQVTVIEGERVPRMDIFTASGGEGLA